jgi:hypothetical protein
MTTFANNEEFFTALRHLIEAWCDRRCLRALHGVLGGYLGFNGLTDSWAELRGGLRGVRAFARDELTDVELDVVDDLIRAADQALG